MLIFACIANEDGQGPSQEDADVCFSEWDVQEVSDQVLRHTR
jgi:hypothetical protein